MINNILTLYRATSIMCGLIVSCIYTHLLPSALSILVGIEVILIILRDFNTLKQKQQTMLPKKLYGIFESCGILCIVLYCVLINSSIVPLLTTIFCIIAWYLFRINIIGYAQEFNYELFFQTLLVLIIATLGYGLFLTLRNNMPAGLNLAILCLLLLLPVNLYFWQNSDIITRLFVISFAFIRV
jgi:hypothetical protein